MKPKEPFELNFDRDVKPYGEKYAKLLPPEDPFNTYHAYQLACYVYAGDAALALNYLNAIFPHWRSRPDYSRAAFDTLTNAVVDDAMREDKRQKEIAKKTRGVNLLVCGSRNWTNINAIRREIKKLRPTPAIIIHGGAPGADTLAGIVAKELYITTIVYYANWELFGHSAGPRRNRAMLYGDGTGVKPDLVFAFHEDIKASKGTRDMVTLAQEHNVTTKIFTA